MRPRSPRSSHQQPTTAAEPRLDAAPSSSGRMDIVRVSLCERLRLCFLALAFGWYLVVRRLIRWAWDPQRFFLMRPRDKPPACLVDDALGRHSYLKLKGVKFHYVEAGSKDKPLLLLLHGFPDCWLSWREQIQVFSEHYRVIALDLKGFGDSDKPANKSSYKIEILIDELRKLIFALGARTCSIVGHDLGGLLGWYMAAIHGDVIREFVAISSPHPNIYWTGTSGETLFNHKWIHFSRLPFLPEIDVLKEDLAVINDTFKHLHIEKRGIERDYVEAYKYTFSRKEDWTGPINYYRNLPYTRLGTNNNQQIRVRTLLVVGKADPSVSLESIVQSSEFVEKCSLKVVQEAGHFPHQEKPEAVNESIIRFLVGNLAVEKLPSKSIVSSWLGSLSTTVKYGNHVLGAVQKRTNGVVNGLPLPNRVLYLGQTST